MNWLLRNYKWAYYGLLLLAVPLFLLMPGPLPQALAFYFVLVLACFVLGGRALSSAASRGVTEYYRDCDPDPMVDNCEKLLRGAGENCASGYILTLRGTRVGGLLALGRLEEAEEELNRLSAALSGKRISPTAVAARGDRIALSLAKNRLQGLEQEIEETRGMLAKTKVPSMFSGISFPELAEWSLEAYSCTLLLRTAGPVPQLQARLGRLLETAPCTLYQVQASAALAEYHLARGEQDNALPYLRFVAQAGGKLEKAVRARDRLARMGK